MLKKIFLSIFLLGFFRVSHAATQVYIPSTWTYHNYVVNIESETANNLYCTTCTATKLNVSSLTATNLSISTGIFTQLNVSSAVISNLSVSTGIFAVGTAANFSPAILSGLTTNNSTSTYNGINFFKNGISVTTGPAQPVFEVVGSSADFTMNGSSIVVMQFGGVAIKGTNTNDSASPGYVGQVISSTTVTTNFPTNSNYGDLVSVSLTPGDWICSAQMNIETIGNTTTNFYTGISQTSGNSATGLTSGDTRLTTAGAANITAGFPLTIINVRESLSATTTIYMKYLSVYSGTTPQASGRMTCIRSR